MSMETKLHFLNAQLFIVFPIWAIWQMLQEGHLIEAVFSLYYSLKSYCLVETYHEKPWQALYLIFTNHFFHALLIAIISSCLFRILDLVYITETNKHFQVLKHTLYCIHLYNRNVKTSSFSFAKRTAFLSLEILVLRIFQCLNYKLN